MAVLLGLAIALVELHGPGGQRILINPAEVVSVREPRGVAAGHFAPGVRCLLTMVDGSFVTVIESCDSVRAALEGARP